MRPTGRLHLGNWLGALSNWVRLQDEFECFYCIVDWHALATDYEDTSRVPERIREVLIDWLSAGLDPERSVLFVQSDVKEHAELHLLLSMLTPLSWVERVPTFKEQLRQLEGREIATYGMLGYPVLQTADILAYRADTVPVGEDQLPHLELAREIARRFNHLYGTVFPEPQGRLTEIPLVPGTDGRKMSKSYGNTIELADAPDEVRRKVQQMVTDPQRIRKSDPGRPEICTVYAFYKALAQRLPEVEERCRGARIGCVGCKKELGEVLSSLLEPVYHRRRELENNPGVLREILREGSRKAGEVARATLEECRRAMNLCGI
ncbi:MAG: tryptophan--tRNA ligase [Firmicutes bacterium]|nr:tryptophan--tRNA ligase [Bacillota bacterium]